MCSFVGDDFNGLKCEMNYLAFSYELSYGMSSAISENSDFTEFRAGVNWSLPEREELALSNSCESYNYLWKVNFLATSSFESYISS